MATMDFHGLTSDAYTAGITASSGTDCYLMVDDVTPDDDDTYVSVPGLGYAFFNCDYSALPAGAVISNVRIWMRARSTTTNVMAGFWVTDHPVYNSTDAGTGATYVDCYYDYALNPVTSAVWNIANLATYGIGGYLNGDGARCTQVYATVDYTAGATPPTFIPWMEII